VACAGSERIGHPSTARIPPNGRATSDRYGRVPRNPLAISGHKRLGSKSRFAAKYNSKMSNRKSKNPAVEEGNVDTCRHLRERPKHTSEIYCPQPQYHLPFDFFRSCAKMSFTMVVGTESNDVR
jgi:hypothetical protein